MFYRKKIERLENTVSDLKDAILRLQKQNNETSFIANNPRPYKSGDFFKKDKNKVVISCEKGYLNFGCCNAAWIVKYFDKVKNKTVETTA